MSEPGAPTAVVLEVRHETRYDYAAPVSVAHHLAHLKPLDDAFQQLEAFALEIEPDPGAPIEQRDSFGNAVHRFSFVAPHADLVVRARSRVRVTPRVQGLEPAAAPPWEALRDRLRYVARAPFDPAVEFVQPSPYVPRLEALRAWAAPSFPPAAPVAVGALDLMHRLHAEFRYRARSTEVDTPLAEAFERRTGVCQDFAHVLVGALRMLGLPARYVSGYLLTQGPGEGPVLVGDDASHAWVQVQAPGTPGLPADGWLDLDPTNDLVPQAGHVRLAVGRDYGDVMPLRGVIRGGGRHTLTVGVSTRRLEAGAGPDVASMTTEDQRARA